MLCICLQKEDRCRCDQPGSCILRWHLDVQVSIFAFCSQERSDFSNAIYRFYQQRSLVLLDKIQMGLEIMPVSNRKKVEGLAIKVEHFETPNMKPYIKQSIRNDPHIWDSMKQLDISPISFSSIQGSQRMLTAVACTSLTGASLSRKTASWASISDPKLAWSRSPEFPTTAQVANCRGLKGGLDGNTSCNSSSHKLLLSHLSRALQHHISSSG